MHTPLDRPNERILELETAQGRKISNAQNLIAMESKQVFDCRESFKKKYPSMIERTSSPTGMYNCHGMVFAARRTQIIDAQTIRDILADDGYKKIPSNSVLPGDIVLYLSPDGDIEHSGIVVAKPEASLVGQPMVISKWGPFTEVLHPAYQSPYDWWQCYTSFFN